jgi:hypothetical protein
VSAPELCPALRLARQESGQVICDGSTTERGAWSFVCWRCLEVMLRRAKDREAQRQEWELEP